MAKKQTRRSISVSRATYERLKAFCETNSISMSQFVETRVGDFLSEPGQPAPSPSPSGPARPVTLSVPSATKAAPVAGSAARFATPTPAPTPVSRPAVPMTSAAARFAVEPPPPIIKQKAETAAPKPAEKRADQIFTF